MGISNDNAPAKAAERLLSTVKEIYNTLSGNAGPALERRGIIEAARHQHESSPEFQRLHHRLGKIFLAQENGGVISREEPFERARITLLAQAKGIHVSPRTLDEQKEAVLEDWRKCDAKVGSAAWLECRARMVILFRIEAQSSFPFGAPVSGAANHGEAHQRENGGAAPIYAALGAAARAEKALLSARKTGESPV